MSGAAGSDRQEGQWLVNAIVAIVVGFAVAIAVVALSVVIDRQSRPAVEIVNQQPASPVVQVFGAVATPGVYVLPRNARLDDAIVAAGGLDDDADQSQLNLAARIGDGERVVIPTFVAEVSSASVGTPGESGRININTASAAELELLPGIGPVLASRIVEERGTNGPFTAIDDLVRVQGISSTMVTELRPLVALDD